MPHQDQSHMPDKTALPVPGVALWIGILLCALILGASVYWLSAYAGTRWLS